jgi:hypothetical protein
VADYFKKSKMAAISGISLSQQQCGLANKTFQTKIVANEENFLRLWQLPVSPYFGNDVFWRRTFQTKCTKCLEKF